MTTVAADPRVVGYGWRLARAHLPADTLVPDLRPIWQDDDGPLGGQWVRARCQGAAEADRAAAADRRDGGTFHRSTYSRMYRSDAHTSPTTDCACGFHVWPTLSRMVRGLRVTLPEQIDELARRRDVVVCRVAYGGAVLGPVRKPSVVTMLADADPRGGALAAQLLRHLPDATRPQVAPGEAQAVRAEFVAHLGPLYVGAGVMNVGSPWRRGLQERYRIVQAHGPLIPAVRSGQILTDMTAAGWSDPSGRR